MCPPELADRYVCDNMIELKYRSISPILTRRTAEVSLRLLSTPSPHLGLVHKNKNRKHHSRKTQERGYRTIRVMCPVTTVVCTFKTAVVRHARQTNIPSKLPHGPCSSGMWFGVFPAVFPASPQSQSHSYAHLPLFPSQNRTHPAKSVATGTALLYVRRPSAHGTGPHPS